MRLEFLLIYKQVGPSKTEIIAKNQIFKERYQQIKKKFQNQNHKKKLFKGR